MPALIAKFSSIHRAILISQLKLKLENATRGALHYGPDGDVVKMQCVSDVLEIRIMTQLGVEGKRLHVRVYFNEPASQPAVLRLLSVRAKQPDAPGLEEQNRHAEVAQARLDECIFAPNDTLASKERSADA